MTKDESIIHDMRTRWKLQVLQDDLYQQRRELDSRIAAVSRQIRRLDDREIAMDHNTTLTRVRKVGLA